MRENQDIKNLELEVSAARRKLVSSLSELFGAIIFLFSLIVLIIAFMTGVYCFVSLITW